MLSNPLVVIQANNDWPRARKLLFAVCLIVFMLQLYRTTVRYYRYETEFQVKQNDGRKDIVDVPAITLCTESDAVFLKSNIRKRYPQMESDLKIIDNKTLSDSAKESLKRMIYGRYVQRGHTYSYFFDISIKDKDFVECYLRPPTVYMKRKYWEIDWTDCSGFSPVLESHVSSFGKCFTYFSRQQTDGIRSLSDLQLDLSEIPEKSPVYDLIVSFDKIVNDNVRVNWPMDRPFPTSSRKSIFMFIHDSYRMPSFDKRDALEVKPGKSYDIRFWSDSKSLLRKPFRSSCEDYRKNLMVRYKPKSVDQSYRRCYIEKSVQYNHCLAPEEVLVNDENLMRYGLSLCRDIKDYLRSLKISQMCRSEHRHKDCHQTEYKFDYKESELGNSDNTIVTTPAGRHIRKFSFLSVTYKQDSDYQYVERPVQSMCDTIHKIFLFLVIWFGLSVFSFTSVLESMVSKARPQIYQIFEDRVSPLSANNLTDVAHSKQHSTQIDCLNAQNNQPMIKPKFVPTTIGSNLKLEHYNDFVSKVVDGYPMAPPMDLSVTKINSQY